MNALYCISWTEYERGWGSRPDGITLHRTKEDAEEFAYTYLHKNNKSNYVPDIYSIPNGDAKLIEVSEALFKVMHSANAKGKWFHSNSTTSYKTWSGE